MASSSTPTVFPKREIKPFPNPPPNVTLAFEKLQVPSLLSKLQGPEEQQIQAIDLLLETWLDPVRVGDGLKNGVIELLIFLLRTVAGEGLRGKLAKGLRVLAGGSGGRKELIAAPNLLSDIRSAVSESKSVKLEVLELVVEVARSHDGSATLVEAGYWTWLVDKTQSEGDADVKSLVFQCLGLIKAGCNTPDTDISKAQLKQLVDKDLVSWNYQTHCLDFVIALCRLESAKKELVSLDVIPKLFDTFVKPFLASDSTDPREPVLVMMCAKALQLLASLALIVPAKHQIFKMGVLGDLYSDARVVLHPKLCRASLPFALTLVESPDIRMELKVKDTFVARIRKAHDDQKARETTAQTNAASVLEKKDANGRYLNKLPVPTEETDGYIAKMSEKLLAALFWEP